MRGLSLALVLCASLSCGTGAHAFVVDAPGGGSGDPVQDLQEAARWDMNPGPLLETGERGLGGGLEYAIDPSVCAALVFADDADCAAISAQIAEAAARWAEGHPALAFTDVTSAIAPVAAPEDQPWLGHGAEIDFFAAPQSEFDGVHEDGVAADTRSYYLFQPAPRDPEGRVQDRARGRITAVDVRFNTDVCFHLAADADAPGCVHFGSVVMHEIAHALGLDHPDQHPQRNLDVNGEPGDAMTLDCGAPAALLKASARTERYAVANGRWSGAGYWTRGLTYDDYAGRDALYPACDIEHVTAASGGEGRWGAFALSDDGAGDAFGWARDSVTQDSARLGAERACAQFAGGCEVAAVFSDCFAYARSSTGSWGWAVRDDLASARRGAVENCAREGGSCEAPVAMCASPSRELSG